ncbi:DMT family transporter [Nonomuraea jabiensis]|uniref:DMT family transporter n=1 Tax=Nonomuraea jabiensis TaxID=882448 RepID=UPI003D75CF34
MAWLLLTLAIAIEIGASTALRAASHGQPPGSSATLTSLALAGVVLSYTLMAAALRQQMEVGIAYALWSGVGTAAIAVIGILAFGESVSSIKMLAIVLIVAGVILLQLAPQARTTTVARTTMPPSRPAVVVVRPSPIQALAEALTEVSIALTQQRPTEPAFPPAPRGLFAEPAARTPGATLLPVAAASANVPSSRTAASPRHAGWLSEDRSRRTGTAAAVHDRRARPPAMPFTPDGEPRLASAPSRGDASPAAPRLTPSHRPQTGSI